MADQSAGWQADDDTGVYTLVSCGFTWLFDFGRRRFRRVPRGAALDVPVRASAWNQYHRLELDDERPCFTVVLDARGTSVLRSWFHLEPCPYCDSPTRPHRGGPDR